jgi:hypothetical protein
MKSNENLKLSQWRKLFNMFQYRLMQSLNIFGTREGLCFEFQFLEEFEIYLERLKGAGPTGQWPLSLLAHARRAPGTQSRSWSLPFHRGHRTTATSRHPTWARPYLCVANAVEKFSSPFTPSHLASPLLHLSHAHRSIHCCLPPPQLLITVQAKDLVRYLPLFK